MGKHTHHHHFYRKNSKTCILAKFTVTRTSSPSNYNPILSVNVRPVYLSRTAGTRYESRNHSTVVKTLKSCQVDERYNERLLSLYCCTEEVRASYIWYRQWTSDTHHHLHHHPSLRANNDAATSPDNDSDVGQKSLRNKGGTTPPQRYGSPACEVPIALVQTFGLIIVTTCLDICMIIHVPHHT